MKRFLAFLHKEFLHIFRDVRTLIILFLIPVFQMFIFGYVIKNEVKNAKIIIVDKSNDVMTASIISKLSAASDIEVVDIWQEDKDSEEYFKSNKVKAVVVLDSDFANNFTRQKEASVQIILDATDPNFANLLNSYIVAVLNEYSYEKNSNNYKINVSIEPRMLFNENLNSAYMFVPGTMALILMVITALMSSISIVREKELGTMEVLLVSPLRPAQIILGKLTPYAILSIINAVSIILIGHIVFGVPIIGKPLNLLIVSAVFILMALSLGLLISTISNAQHVAMFISMFGLLLPTMLLSGFIFPIENMPVALQYISKVVPAKYFLLAIKNVMLKGLGFVYIGKDLAILSIMTIICIVISILKFKVRLD